MTFKEKLSSIAYNMYVKLFIVILLRINRDLITILIPKV